MFYAVICVALAAQFLSKGSVSPYALPFDRAFGHFALIDGVGVLWTVPVEMQFYLCFVGLWWLNTRSRRALIALCVAAIAIYWALPVKVPSDPRAFPYYAVFFLCGLLASRAIDFRAPPALSRWLVLLLVLGSLTPFLLYPDIYKLAIGAEGWLARGELQQMWHDPRYALSATMCLCAAICARPVQVVLSHPIFRQAGAISYSVYLLHLPVIELLARYSTLRSYPVAFLALTVTITTVASALTYAGFELPIRKRLTRYLPDDDNRNASVATSVPGVVGADRSR